MSRDSQNSKKDYHDNVVPIRSGEDGTEIEQKLAAARRLFSLHEYSLCEQLVQEVLAADPHSSKAKALLELASIKLSKRKLFKKMVGPKPPSSPQESPSQTEPLNLNGSKNPSPRAGSSNRDADDRSATQGSTLEETPPTKIRSSRRPLQVRPETSGEKSPKSPTNSMRERTIAAMAELLRDRNKELEDWKDPQFGLAPRKHSADEVEAPVSDPGKASTVIPTLPEPILELSPEPRIVPVKVEGPQVIQENILQSRSEARPALQENFLPGSLEKLFENTRDLDNEHLRDHERKIQLVELTPIPDERPPVQHGEEVLLSPHADHPAVPRDEKGAKLKIEHGAQVFKHPRKVEGPALPESPPPQEQIQRVVHLPKVNVFDRITPAHEAPPHQFIDQKLEQRSEEIHNSEIKAVSIAQIKKYLYQEQYDLCSQELERIRELFPQNAEIQVFAENTSRRLVELKAMKNFEAQAEELMRSAVSFYQEGKFPEALDAAQQVLRGNSNHTQAREFVEFVHRRINPEEKKGFETLLERYCKNCGANVDPSSQFCHHCGKRML